MTSLSIKEYNQQIDRNMKAIKKLKTEAQIVTLTELIEKYSNDYDYLSLASFWYNINDDIDIDNFNVGLTD